MTSVRLRLLLFGTAVVCGSLFGAATDASAVVIDDFSTTTIAPTILTAPGASVFNDVGVAGVAGGDRTVTLSATMASSIVNGVGFGIGGGQLTYGSGPAADGAIGLSYTGAGLAGALGGAPLSILVNFLSFDDGFNLGMDVTVTVSDGTDTAQLTQSIVGSSPGPFTLSFALANFMNVGMVDLANLTSIDVDFEAGQGQDFVLGSITALVPEPGAVMVWGTVFLTAGLFLRRRRNKS